MNREQQGKLYRYPFTAIVGQEQMKLALLLNLIYPEIGGVLIVGEKGTAKSTIVRALTALGTGSRVVELPLGTTEDKLLGSIDMEAALQSGVIQLEPGILYHADQQILYVDEINLLEDHLVDVLLDVSAMGVNYIEREGISYSHPARFVLVGSMNPEEGDLRPQLLDRFGLSVEVRGERNEQQRCEILRRRIAFERNPDEFLAEYRDKEQALSRQIKQAKELLPRVSYTDEILQLISQIAIRLEVDGHRADLTLLKSGIALAAWNQREVVKEEDILKAAELALPHRMRRRPFEEMYFGEEDLKQLLKEG